jgi:hypothetical protein
MPASDDLLLYVLSASGQVGYREFRQVYSELYRQLVVGNEVELEQVNYGRLRTLRALQALGHVDLLVLPGETKVQVAPPVLSRLPVRGLPQAILCGARGPTMTNLLRQAREQLKQRFEVEVNIQLGRSAGIPKRILVLADSDETLSHLATILGVHYSEAPSAWALASLSGSLAEYIESREWTPSDEINWTRDDWSSDRLRFVPPGTGAQYRLSRYLNRVTTLHRYFLWNGDVRAEVDLDWGRYAVLSHSNENVLLYDPATFRLATPVSVPLPKLLGRAIALCSGYAARFLPRSHVAPTSPETYGYDLYTGVPHDIAIAVATKLNQNLVETHLPKPR